MTTGPLDSIFRDEWPRLVATLVKDFGDLDIAEESIQDAFVEAAKRWGSSGIPERAGAWLLTVARRKAIDRLRRAGRLADKIAELEATAERKSEAELTTDALGSSQQAANQELVDDQLALLLGCCHPALNMDAQVALTLRVVAGLRTDQIARAFLVTEDTMVRRITRAKTKIRGAGISFSVPDRAMLASRVQSVNHVIYLIFNEGHTRSSGGEVSGPAECELVHGDLCDEAIWLSELLTTLVPDNAEVLGLAALIQLTDSRRASRVDPAGLPVLLENQDRATWDQTKITLGNRYLGAAHELAELGPFQIQAAIQSLHAAAASLEDTKWDTIVRMYDMLLLRRPSAVVALNRAVAASYLSGPDSALASVEALADALDHYVYFHSTRGELLLRAEQPRAAASAFERAHELASNDSEARHLLQRLGFALSLSSG